MATVLGGKERAVQMLQQAQQALDVARNTPQESQAWQHWIGAQRYWMSWLTPQEMDEFSRQLAANAVTRKRG